MNRGYWPITIVKDRYGGAYSEGRWVAFNLTFDAVPQEVHGSDPEEMNFWDRFGGPLGLGDSPQEAYDSLVEVLDELERQEEPRPKPLPKLKLKSLTLHAEREE